MTSKISLGILLLFRRKDREDVEKRSIHLNDMLRRIHWFFEFCLRRKEKGSKETNKQNCERTSAGQSLRKILYDTVEFPLRPVSRCFFKKKKKRKRMIDSIISKIENYALSIET